MDRYFKLLERILHAMSDANIPFTQMCQLLKKFGFGERIHGSHHIGQHPKGCSKRERPFGRYPFKLNKFVT